MKKIVSLGLATILLSACSLSISKPQTFNEAMGWSLTPISAGLYAEVEVVPGGYAESQGFESGDLILLEDYEPGVSRINGVDQPTSVNDYVKSMIIEVCSAGVVASFGEDLEFYVRRADEIMLIEAKDIPRMECA